MQQIISRFDQVLSFKASKKQVEELEEYLEEKFVRERDIEDFKSAAKQLQEEQQQKIAFLDDVVKN